jgi:hypothetical protein
MEELGTEENPIKGTEANPVVIDDNPFIIVINKN